MATAFYRWGPLWFIHWLRNRSVLTVLMFHRVLLPRDSRFACGNPVYTVTDRTGSRLDGLALACPW